MPHQINLTPHELTLLNELLTTAGNYWESHDTTTQPYTYTEFHRLATRLEKAYNDNTPTTMQDARKNIVITLTDDEQRLIDHASIPARHVATADGDLLKAHRLNYISTHLDQRYGFS